MYIPEINHFSDIPEQLQGLSSQELDGIPNCGTFWSYTWFFIPRDENLFIYRPL